MCQACLDQIAYALSPREKTAGAVQSLLASIPGEIMSCHIEVVLCTLRSHSDTV